jgi:hypothetical protein
MSTPKALGSGMAIVKGAVLSNNYLIEGPPVITEASLSGLAAIYVL